MVEGRTNGEDDGVAAEPLDAEKVEEDWNRALDAASGAVSAGSRAHALSPKDVSSETAHIHAQREWLSRFRPTLRRLLPRRDTPEQPPT